MVRVGQAGVAAERLGFQSSFLVEHHFTGWNQVSATLTLLTWLAARTERMTQSHLVLCDGFRHPVMLARQAVSLDHMSGGRFELALGWGSVVDEFHTFGIAPTAPAERVDRMRETLDVIKACWSGEQFDYHGTWFDGSSIEGFTRIAELYKAPSDLFRLFRYRA